MINYATLFTETKNLSVLFVEDYEPLRIEMEAFLEDLFKHVSVAPNGKKAFEMYETAYNDDKHFDLIISDIQMPVMDGVAFSEKVCNLNDTQTIIILSGHSDSEYLVKLINIGVSKFLSKPIDHNEFFSVLYDESKKINRNKVELPIENTIEYLGEGYTWDKQILLLRKNDTPVELTKHELLVLTFFVNKKNYICTTPEIIEHFYTSGVDISEKNIRNLIFKLRKKVPEKCISSVYGLGYKFNSINII